MPQLDIHNPLTLSQVVWMFLIFGALYALLAHWALPRVAVVVESRAAQVTADLESAREAKLAADAALRELAHSTRQAHADAQAEIAAAIARAKEAAYAEARAGDERLDAQLVEAEGRIAAARNVAMRDLADIVAGTTQVLVGRLTGMAVEQTGLTQVVRRLMAEAG